MPVSSRFWQFVNLASSADAKHKRHQVLLVLFKLMETQ